MRRRRLALPLALCATASSGIALAQATGDGPPPPTLPVAATPPPADDAGAIVVTGSRIARTEFNEPNPIVSYNADAIRESGYTNVTSFLARVPALTNSITNSRSAGNAQADGAIGEAGLNLLDLRGLGVNRTLVLVDGRRHVASQINTAAVDINTIPTDLIQRVDVLTGAVSAIYGADGVSGVVNFIMKRDFEGIAARGQFGLSSRGDAANRFASIIAGHNFADGRGNITLAYEYNAENSLSNDDRRYLRTENRIAFINSNKYDPANPETYVKTPVRDIRYLGYVVYDGVRYPGGSYQGIIKIGDRFYTGSGRDYVFGAQNDSNDYSVGGDDTPVAGYIGDILPRTRQHAANLLSKFDASDAFKLTLEGKFVQNTARTFTSYTGNYPDSVSLDNPFIPANILAAALAQPTPLTTIDVYRNNFDLPRRGEEDRRRTWRGVVDIAGRISDHASYDAYYTYGRTDVRATKLNDRVVDRFLQALDAVRDPASGTIQCRSAAARAAGCLPYNPFGQDVADPASFGYFLDDPVSHARIQQHVANASLSGDFGQFFSLPGGPVKFAAGGEYRRESSRFRPATSLTDGTFFRPEVGIYDENVVPTASSGHFDVKELFGELQAPLLKDRPFAYLLSAGAAGRYSHYSTVGGTNTYQFNGVYAPIQDVSFRGSYGRAVRAPNIAELFRPRTGNSNFITDPCYLNNRNQGTQYRPANCEALIAAAGGNPATFTAANNPQGGIDIAGNTQGNPDLRAEAARTWTAGMVLRPRFVPRLEIALDWYDIRIKNAINLATPTDLANLCVDLPSTDNVFCSAVNRRSGTGYIDGYTVQPENVAAFRTAGLELNIAYSVRTAKVGRFDVHLVGGYLHRLDQIPLPGALVIDYLDQPFRPKYNLVFSPTWTIGPVLLAYNLHYQNGTRRFSRIETDSAANYVDPRYFRFKELWQHDLQASFKASDRFSFYTGVTNLTDEKPGIGFETNVPISPLGRYLYAGVRLAFDPGR